MREVAAPRIGGAREQGRRWRRLGLVARASRGWTADGSGGGAQGEYGRGFGDRAQVGEGATEEMAALVAAPTQRRGVDGWVGGKENTAHEGRRLG